MDSISSSSFLIEFSAVHALPNAPLTERSWPVGRRLSWTASVVVNMGEFIPPCRSPSFILAGQQLPKSSHTVWNRRLGRAWRLGGAGEGGKGEESSGDRRPVKVPVGQDGEGCQDWRLNSRGASAGFVLWITCGQTGAIT